MPDDYFVPKEVGSFKMTGYKTFAGILALALSGFATVAAADFQFRYPSSVEFKTGMTGGGETAPKPEVSPEVALAAWEDFAAEKGLTHGADWNLLSWNGSTNSNLDLSALPTEPYPNAAPTGMISLLFVNIGSLAGFAHVTSIGGSLMLQADAIGSVDGGFSRLTSVSGSVVMRADISFPNLEFVGLTLNMSGTTFAPFPKLRSVSSMVATQLVDASSLAQLESINSLKLLKGISEQPGFVPIPKSSWICQAAGESLFQDSNYASQSEACGDGPGE